MIFPKQCRLHLVAANENGRYAMASIRHTPGKLSATDGRRLAIVNVTEDEDDTDGALIPAHLVKLAVTKAPTDEAIILANGDAKALTKDGVVTTDLVEGDFPSFETVIPNVPETRRTLVAFNAKNLYELAQALGAESNVVVLELDLERMDTMDKGSYESPIQIRTPHGTGVIMPVTIESS